MRELPVDAKAICTDGEAGWVTDVVVDPAARAITHIVIRENNTAGREFLIPLDQVTDSSRSTVRLGCVRADLQKFPEFTTTHYVPASSPEAQPVVAQWEMDAWTYSYRYEPIYAPVVSPDMPVPIDEHHVPSGEMAFERGASIESSDGKLVGEIEAFIVRPDNGIISHFVVRLDESGSAREITLPLSTVQQATPAIVRLKLTQAQLERLPAVPTGGDYSSASERPDALHLVSVVFADPAQAEVGLHLSQQVDKKLHAAVVRKNDDGDITAREEHDVSARGGAAAGAVLGGVLSLVAGPVGFVAGTALGGVAGAAVGRMVDRGIPDRYVRDLGRALRSGSSALVVLVPASLETTLLNSLAPLNGQILRLELSDEMVARLTEPG
jgi:uncharacterized membrane protein/sporulation protein YlmC with PRC-barrel domain